MHEEYKICNNKATEESKLNLEGLDQNREKAKHFKGGGTWKLRDCRVKAAKDKCDSEQLELIHDLPYDLMPGLKEMCKDYTSGCVW